MHESDKNANVDSTLWPTRPNDNLLHLVVEVYILERLALESVWVEQKFVDLLSNPESLFQAQNEIFSSNKPIVFTETLTRNQFAHLILKKEFDKLELLFSHYVISTATRGILFHITPINAAHKVVRILHLGSE